jgi:hypothetical protein
MLGTNGAANETVYKYSGVGTSWTALTGTITNATALVELNGGLCMLGTNGAANETVYKYSGVGTSWAALTGSNTQVFQLMNGSGNLYMVATNGGSPSVWQYTGQGSNWTPLTGTSLQTALAAWQLGLGHPMAATAYSPASGTLFGPSGPSYLDVQQGQVGDCWLMASLAETAARMPADINSMFIYDGTTVENGSTVGVYSVRLYTSSGVAQYVTVDTELPSGGSYYDRPVGGPGAINGASSPVLWVALAEKAYAEANGAGYVTTGNEYCNAYDATNGGWPRWALQAITDLPAGHYSFNTTNLASDWNAGKLVVLNTTTPSSSYIVAPHCYALVNYVSSSPTPYQVFNPWGTDANGWAPGFSGTVYGRFWATSSFMSQNFSTEDFAGAVPNQHPGPWGRNTAIPSYEDGLLLDDAIVLQSLLQAQRRSSEQSAAPGGQEGRHAWSSQQPADWVFTEVLLAPPSNS